MEPQKPVANKWGWVYQTHCTIRNKYLGDNIHKTPARRTNGNAIPQVWGRACANPYADFWRFVVVTDGVTDVGSALTAD